MNHTFTVRGIIPAVALFIVMGAIVPCVFAGNGVLGQVDLVGSTKVEETSGVWVDGQYVGYLRELKGSKKFFSFPASTKSPCARADI